MNVLDENVPRDQADLLRQWGVRFRSVSRDLGYSGISDDNIVPLLRRLKRPTFLTRDRDFFIHDLVHAGYALIWFDVKVEETAFFVRCFLKHPFFRLNSQRLGNVVRVHPRGIEYWTRTKGERVRVEWK